MIMVGERANKGKRWVIERLWARACWHRRCGVSDKVNFKL
jgi:hypothetical protein